LLSLNHFTVPFTMYVSSPEVVQKIFTENFSQIFSDSTGFNSECQMVGKDC